MSCQPQAANLVDRWLSYIQDGLFGRGCDLCGVSSSVSAGRAGICKDCMRDLPWAEPGCQRCGAAVSSGLLCGRCQHRPPAFERVRCVFDYGHPVDALIHGLKYHRRLAAARTLGRLMAEKLTSLEQRPELLLPVPLHPRRLRERGFNQALELARVLGRRLDLPLEYGRLRRTRNTPMQSGLPARQRSANVKGAFSYDGKIDAARVAIVDDVMTTGATVAELATALQRAGASSIEVWVCARARR